MATHMWTRSLDMLRWPPTALLLLLLLILELAGCSREPSGSEQSKPSVLELTIAINAGVEGQAIAALAADYPYADVEVVELPYTNLRERLSHSLSTSRATYDVVMLDDPWFPELERFLAPFRDVSDSLIKDIIPACLSLGRSPYPDGEIRALPFVGNCQLLFFRQDVLEDFGVQDVPATWETVLALCNRPAQGAEDRFVYCIRGRAGAPIVSDFLPILWSNGGQLFDDRGNPQSVAINKETLASSLQVYRQLAACSPRGAIAFDWNEMTAAFSSGKVALQLNWPAAVATLEEAIERAPNGKRVWGVAMPPRGRTNATSMAGNWLLGIPTFSKNHKEAEAFVYWLFDHQLEAALMGNPPTRISVFKSPEIRNDDRFFYYDTLQEALMQCTPRPRTLKWNAAEQVVGEVVSGYITGQYELEPALEMLSQQLNDAIK